MPRLGNLLLLLQNHLRDVVLQLLTVSSFGYRASGWCLGYYSRFHKNRNDLKITRLGWGPDQSSNTLGQDPVSHGPP